jgi:uncharacterized membrane protein
MYRPDADTVRSVARWLLAALYLVAGYFHLTHPGPFLRIMPAAVPFPEQVIFWTGLAEIAGALGLLQPWSVALRRAAGGGLALYALCVWPANIRHFAMDMHRADHGWGLGYHVPRMLAQPLLIWLALWTAGAIRWPFPPRERKNDDALDGSV